MERVRVRLLFENPNILSDLQKSEGLRRSWFLLKPQQHKTISDLSFHILTTFQLHHSSPHGLLLFMDDFLLPPFESTCILKDKCIVSVKKKGDVLAIEGNDAPNIAENNRIVEKQPVNTGQFPLTNEEFDNESGGYESEDESEDEEGADLENSLGCNVISRKRKASDTLPSSKKRKHCSEDAEKVDEQAKKSQQDLTSKNSLCKQKKVADLDSKDVDNNKGSAESSKVNASISGMKKNNKLQEKDVENVEAITKPERVKKGPSRSSRKQYAKRQRLREMIKFYENATAESEGLANAGRRAGKLRSKWHVNGETDGRPKGRGNWKQQQSKAKNQEVIGQPKGLLHWKQSREEDKGGNTHRQEQANEKSTLCEKTGQHSDMEDEIVPDQALQQDQVQEIDFSSVLEVRLVKNGTSDSVAGLSGEPSEGPATNGTSDSVAGLSGRPSKGPASNESNPVLSTSEKKTDGPTTDNVVVNLWEQLSETIKAKTGQSNEESSWGKWNRVKSSWSHRALTGSSCGPAMASRGRGCGPTMAFRGRGRGPTMAFRGRGCGPTMAFRGRGRGPTMNFRGRGRGYNGR